MSGFFQNLLKDTAGGFFGSDYLRDYTHANKIFGTNLYQYAPKLKFLFHAYFNINQDVFSLGSGVQGNYGLIVREVKLPSYTFQTYAMNQYNRKRIIQTKIKYDPVSFVFYDDNSNAMARLWASYYNYYYGDGTAADVTIGEARGGRGQDLGSAVRGGSVNGLGNNTIQAGANGAKYFDRNQYDKSITDNVTWGYIGDNNSGAQGNRKPPFFKDITIYGFYQKNFIAYTLVNPIITQFAHDTYDYEQGNGVMKNTMTLDYETVTYNEGKMAGEKSSGGGLVPGFNEDGYYDKMLSPIAVPGSNNKVLGNGGLVDGLSGTLNQLGNKNFIGAIKTAGATINTFKNINIKQSLKNELKNSFLQGMRNPPNESRNLAFSFKNASSGPGNPTAAGAPPTGSAGGTDSTPNTNVTKSPAYQVSPSGGTVVDFGAYGGFGGVDIPQNPPPAGKQSTTGQGANLPSYNEVWQNNNFG